MAQPYALIVDDDADVRQVLAEFVEREGFAVTTAGTLAEARSRSRPVRPTSCWSTFACPTAAGWTSWKGGAHGQPGDRPDHRETQASRRPWTPCGVASSTT